MKILRVYKLLCHVLMNVILISNSFANKTIYIYSGPGVSEESLKHTRYTVKNLVHSYYEIEEIEPDRVTEGTWRENASLFIMPGGDDAPYCKRLNSDGNYQIKSFINSGGAFLGLCAGSYYGGKFIEFAKNTKIEDIGPRELGFFPGTVQGPILAPYDHRSYSGSLSTSVLWQLDRPFHKNKDFKVFYNGGGYFVDADSFLGIEVLATYQFKHDQKAAIVECNVGKGTAILSAVHVEYEPALLNGEDEYLMKIIPDLKEGNIGRIHLMSHLFERLGIKGRSISKL